MRRKPHPDIIPPSLAATGGNRANSDLQKDRGIKGVMVAEHPHGSGKGKQKQRRPNGQYEHELNREDAIQLNGAAKVRQELKRLAKMRKRLLAMVCSDTWAIDNWYHGEPFPPGGDNSLMVTCRRCGRITPPNCVGSSGACDDCRLGTMSPAQLAILPSSTSSINLAKVRAAIRRGEQPTGGF